jgi:hypothetical protein
MMGCTNEEDEKRISGKGKKEIKEQKEQGNGRTGVREMFQHEGEGGKEKERIYDTADK